MLSKLTIAILLICLAISLYFNFSSRQLTDDDDDALIAYQQYVDSVDIDQGLIDSWKKALHRDSTGGYISLQAARDLRDAHRRWWVLKRQPHGFAFGINQLQKMLDNIKVENDRLIADKDSNLIEAVRVYLIRNKDAKTNKKYLDVLLWPARADGSDYEFSSIVDTDPILDRSAPCPDVCP